MSSKTVNYELNLEDDATARFKAWRESINGTINSNTVIIDRVLGEKADSSQALSKTLYADQWTASGSIFLQDIAIDGLTAQQNGIIGVAQSLTEEQLEATREAGLYISQQSDGSLTIALDGEVPSCDIPVVIILWG